MRKCLLLILMHALWLHDALAQCSMCTKTAASLDDKAARGLNGGIIYLAFLPLLMIGFIGFRWWKQQRHHENV